MTKLQMLQKAAETLEQYESEYTLQQLLDATKKLSSTEVTQIEVIQLLKQHWVKFDHLEIYHLNLTKTQEEEVYS